MNDTYSVIVRQILITNNTRMLFVVESTEIFIIKAYLQFRRKHLGNQRPRHTSNVLLYNIHRHMKIRYCYRNTKLKNGNIRSF